MSTATRLHSLVGHITSNDFFLHFHTFHYLPLIKYGSNVGIYDGQKICSVAPIWQIFSPKWYMLPILVENVLLDFLVFFFIFVVDLDVSQGVGKPFRRMCIFKKDVWISNSHVNYSDIFSPWYTNNVAKTWKRVTHQPYAWLGICHVWFRFYPMLDVLITDLLVSAPSHSSDIVENVAQMQKFQISAYGI